MTKEQYLKHKEIIDAWANGAEIEFKTIDDGWVDAKNPNWILDLEYRVKPQPNYLELHEKCELKVGDRVRVIKLWTKKETDDCLGANVSDDVVNKAGVIMAKDNNSYKVRLEGINTNWFYPYFVLEKVVEEWTPFTFEDDLVGRTVIHKKEGSKYLIIIQDKTLVEVSYNTVKYDDLLKHYTFLDGSPCGKLK